MQDDTIKHVHERCKTYYDEEGNPLRSNGTVQDITEQVAIEEQLRRSKKMDALGKLTGGIAHDYNNLLGIIHGYSELLKEHLSDQPKLVKYASNIHHAAERGARLTKKLLAFTRNKTSDAIILNINNMLQEEQLLLEKTLTTRIQLVFDLAEDLWPVELDIGDLEDAIINMCINASYAMPSNGKLTFRTSNEKLSVQDTQLLHLDAGDYVLLSITDTGCGMDQATKEKIFDPFFSTKGEGGTGLGLSQVYGFIERSGGVIKVYSEPGHGSRFALYFPRSHQTISEVQSAENISAPIPSSGEVLLVVDDEPAMVDLAYEILTAQGYHVLTANDGEQALNILSKEKVDLMISDVIMPSMDGYQLAKQVLLCYPHIKIQMVSGFSDDRHIELNDDALHQNMLYKPYSSNTLLSRVQSLLEAGNTNEKAGSRSILVMDDDDSVRALFKLHLSKLGYETIEACDGDEAIKLYETSMLGKAPIDAMIIDLSIPGVMGGKEVAAKILAIDPNAKMIVASGNSGGPEMTHYLDYGFCGALEKDFNREKIKQVLDKALHKR
jgi:CheY-like chemotaxis protein/nitrogen-specific signal transduction histidine kinase